MADTSSTKDLAQHIGQVVPVSVNPALLVLSYIVSLVGAMSTLELIHRRTSRRGYYNNLLLFGAAITMGGVAIWSMHYIGNRATTMLNVVAFFVVTSTTASNTRVVWWRILVSGTLSGAAICGMHYLGNASIKNYHCSYDVGFVIGSVAIAVVASIVALSLFFVFRSTWTNLWWKRGCCALVLAGAVSGMHWCAVMGTTYTLVQVDMAISDLSSRNRTVIVTAFLSFAACLIMACLAIYSARVRKGYTQRAQRITLAAAVFDEHGRILVTPDGFVPSEVVTHTFLQKTQNDTFSTAHPLFHWLFRASRDWPSISALLDGMSRHVSRLPHTGRNPRTGIELVDKEGHIINNYDTVFCELFCLAAAALARQMNEDLADAGILWDEIMATGGQSAPADTVSQQSTAGTSSRHSSSSLRHELDDLAERGDIYQVRRSGHGHLMFLVRKVNNSQVDRLAASGYCFAEPRHVAHIIRSKMQIRTGGLEDKFKAMDLYARGVMLEPGVHVGLFAVRTRFHHMGFDVLVRRTARNLLPSIVLPLERLETADLNLLRRLEGTILSDLRQQLERIDNLTPREAKFASLLFNAICNLQNSVQDPAFYNAKLVAKPFSIPCTPPTNDALSMTCSFIAFTIMIPIHLRVAAPAYEFIPLPFFKTQQLVYQNSPHKAAFARSVHRNLSPTLSSLPADDDLPLSKGLRSFISVPWFSRSGVSSQGRSRGEIPPGAVRLGSSGEEHAALTPCDGSVTSLLRMNKGDKDNSNINNRHISEGKARSDMSDQPAIMPVSGQQHYPGKSSYGGIMVSQEVVINVEDKEEEKGGEMNGGRGDSDDDHDRDVPDMPSPTRSGNHHDSSNSSEPRKLRRQKTQREYSDKRDEAHPRISPQQGDDIELEFVPRPLAAGVSRADVTKEHDNATTTFVDDIFSICIDSSRKM
ncbi:hypothetical protein VTH82DRAFT_6868 [Thermothelomyces myriococcoides]